MTFFEYARSTTNARFTEWLRTQARSEWNAMINHEFTRRMADGTLPALVFKRYLVLEYAFVETSVTVLGRALSKAPDMACKARLANAVHELTTTQADYFQDTFRALGVPEAGQEPARLPEVVRSFQDLMVRVSLEYGYEEALSAMLAAEWMYLTWCTEAHQRPPAQQHYATWIAIHVDAAFADGVDWMRAQLDERGPAIASSRQAGVADIFQRVLAMEAHFHTAAFEADLGVAGEG